MIKADIKKQLEQIYTLETVDARTVRTFKKEERQQVEKIVPLPNLSLPLELDLGDRYRGWMESFLPEEPLQCLLLSGATERALLQSGKKQLKDIMQGNLLLGQGHLDEITKKLQNYLSGRFREQMVHFDLLAFLRAVTIGCEPKMVASLFESFGLKGVIPLSPADRASLHTGKERFEQQGRQALLERKTELSSRFSRAMTVYVVPWIERRGRIGIIAETEERLVRVSLQQDLVRPFLTLFATLFDQRAERLSFYGEGEVVASDRQAYDHYIQVVSIAKSYFYRDDIAYPLEFLVQHILKETVQKWLAISPDFIVKSIQYSSAFRITKDAQQTLVVSHR